MADIAELKIKVDGAGNIDATTKSLSNLVKAADSAESSVGMLGAASSKMGSIMKSLAGVAKVAGAALFGAAAIATVKSFSASSSAAQDLASRLELLSGSAEQAEAANRRLQQIAYESNADITELTETYIRLGRGFKDVGFSANDTADFIRALNDALILSGANAETSSVIQANLSRSIASGGLRGNELNAIMERGGKVARLLAQELGTTVGGLREMGAQGKITSEVIHSALVGNMQELAEEAAKMPISLDGAIKKIGNSIEILSDRFDESWGRGSALPGLVAEIGDALLVLEPVAEIAGLAVAGLTEMMTESILSMFGDTQEETEKTAEEIKLEFDELAKSIGGTFDDISAGVLVIADIIDKTFLNAVRNAASAIAFLREEWEAMWSGNVQRSINNHMQLLDTISERAGEAAKALSGGNIDEIFADRRARGLESRLERKLAAELDKTRKGFEAQGEAAEKAGKAGRDNAKQNIDAINAMREAIYQTTLSAEELVKRQAELQLNEFASGAQVAGIRALAIELEHAKAAANFVDKIKDLDEQIFQAGLSSKELALRQAELSLGDYATPDQIERVRNLAGELYRVTVTHDELKRVLEATEPPVEKANRLFTEQVQVLRDAKLSGEEYAKALNQISAATITDAPTYGGLDAVVGGPGGEIVKIMEQTALLDNWRETELDKQQQYLEQKLISEQNYADRVEEINLTSTQRLASLQQAYQTATLASFSTVTGDVASMLAGMGKEGSAVYKALFAVSKAASIAQAIVNTETAATKALSIDPTGSMAAVTRAAGYLSVATIAAQSIAGMAHDGIDSVPQDGTWLLQKGERVMTSETSAKLDRTLDSLRLSRGTGQSSSQVYITINNDGSTQTRGDDDGVFTKMAGEIQQLVDERIKEREARSYRQGGVAWQNNQGAFA